MALFGEFSQARMVKSENGFLRCVQHLERQVLSTHISPKQPTLLLSTFRAFSSPNYSTNLLVHFVIKVQQDVHRLLKLYCIAWN